MFKIFKNYSNTNPYIFLIGIFIIFLITLPIFSNLNLNTKQEKQEGFETIEDSQKNLLSGYYPSTNKKVISDNGASNIWRYYPIFEVGSYEQITNNIRYPKNPDEGTCTSADFCGSLYKDINLKELKETNRVQILEPVKECVDETRVNYYNTNQNMLLRFKNYGGNILY